MRRFRASMLSGIPASPRVGNRPFPALVRGPIGPAAQTRPPASQTDSCGASLRRAWVVGLFAASLAFLIYWAPAAMRGWADVDAGTDSVPYTNVALQVAQGHGLAENASDPHLAKWFRMPPDAAHAETVASTRWPPLFPLTAGAVLEVSNYNLSAVHTVNCVLMATTCGLMAGFLARRRGVAMAVIFVALFAIVDERTRASARMLMTEPLAALLVTATAIVLMRVAQAISIRLIVLAGVLTGAAILSRSATVLWLPGLMVLVGWLGWQQSWTWKKSTGAAVTFATAALLVCLPWFAHNIRALQAFMPLGSHVYTLPSGWSDASWERGGVWASLGDGYFANVTSPADPPLQRARKQAEYGRQQAMAWIAANPVKSVLLAARKAVGLWASPPSIALTALLFPIVGLILMRSRESIVLAAFPILNTLAVAATWLWEVDRFQVPTLAVLHYASAIGIWALISPLLQRASVTVASDTTSADTPKPAQSLAR
jgi:hypothetical protein